MAKHDSPLMPSRLAKRANLDKDAIYAILDESLYCTISYASDGQPFSIPTSFVRYGDKMYIHGSVGSHFIREIEKGIPVCIAVTLIDALVLAKSAFHHSVNYRSVIVFAHAEKIEDPELKTEAFAWLTNKVVPGSWDYLRPVKANEVQKTTVLAFSLEQASAKIRTGMPNDDEEDKSLPIWSGVVPMVAVRGVPQADAFSAGVSLPEHLQGFNGWACDPKK